MADFGTRANKSILALTILFAAIFAPLWSTGSPALAHKPSARAVTIHDEELFSIEHRLGPYGPRTRARNISERIRKLIGDEKFDPSTLKVTESEDNADITAGDTVIMTITDSDAASADKERTAMAHEYMAIIRATVESEKAKRNVQEIIDLVRWRNISANLMHLMSNLLSLKLLAAGIGLMVVALFAYSIKRSVGAVLTESAQRYTFSKVVEFTAYFVGLVFVTVVFRDTLGNLAVILGAATAGIAFALKEIIVSLAGWVAVSFGDFYKVGDRVQVGSIKGDVIDIGFVRTTLMELGEWVKGDQYTGRIVRIANSVVFSGPIFNYSRDLPFVWDELVVSVKLESDLELTGETLKQIVDETVGEYAEEAKSYWEQVKEKYLVEDEKLDPMVTLDLSAGSLDFTVRYPVDFKKRRSTKDLLLRRIMSAIASTEGRIAVK